jgi:RsiW-degrading membrane proteinase PrsW (M82 family)
MYPLLAALVPAIVLLGYIYWQDRTSPEPVKQLLKATAWGVLAIPITLAIVYPLQWIGIIPEEYTTIFGAIYDAFMSAAIPEEFSKLLVLWLFLRKNPHFDERMDGIVYAVCVSLGFAGLENILYVALDENWASVAITRAIFAVPGHFCFGVMMGYFYSLAKFEPQHRIRYSALALIVPIVAHGVYDAILMIMQVYIPTWLESILMIGFLVFCFRLWKTASQAIKKHRQTIDPLLNDTSNV